jgi:hypothetical protein
MTPFEGSIQVPFPPTNSLAFVHCGRKTTMAAEILKRKLRNFPLGNLTERIASAS